MGLLPLKRAELRRNNCNDAGCADAGDLFDSEYRVTKRMSCAVKELHRRVIETTCDGGAHKVDVRLRI